MTKSARDVGVVDSMALYGAPWRKMNGRADPASPWLIPEKRNKNKTEAAKL